MTFWNQQTRYGLFHQADKNAKKYRSDLLVVFVHGIFGSPAETWEETPEWLSERIGSHVDILNFSYACGLWQKSSIPQAADDLHTCLETAYQHYHFLIFITHSTGGLVVKQMLNTCFDDVLSEIDNKTFRFADSPSLWFKTRRIVNIAVPHKGGDPSLTKIGQAVYNAVYQLAKPFLSLIRTLTQGAADVGKNEIIAALRYNNPWLKALHTRNEEALASSKHLRLPYPASFDILAGSDVAVPTDTEGRRQVTFRGNHDTVKVPDHKMGPIMDILVKQVGDYAGANYYLVMHASAITRKLDALNRELGTLDLIGDSHQEESNTLKAQPNSGNQQQVYNLMYGRLNNDKSFPHQLLLTGSGGVGKSTVMRELIWQLSLDYLMAPSRQQIIPFSMPLQMLSTQEFGEKLSWDGLWRWHENWINELFPDRAFRSTKAISCFDQQAVCIIFDGLDEFLALHHEVSNSEVLQLFRDATKRYRHNQKFSILTVCRTSLPGVENYVASKKDAYEVMPLSLDEAKNHFPICSTWLNYVADQKLMSVVLTPLILSSLDDLPGLEGHPLNATEIIGHSIDSILKRSRLENAKLKNGTLVEREHLLIALMLMAWAFFKNNLGEISLNRIKAEAQVIANEWKAYLKTQALEEEYDSLVNALALLDDTYFISGLIQRTLFITTGHNKVRFSNRQWQDYLIALYFKQCLTLGNVADFGETAFNPVIYRMAGDLMRDDLITEQMAEQVLNTWRETGDSSIVGDVLAFISWTTVAIEPSAVRKFLDDVGNYNEITRIVLLSGFGYRGIESSGKDRSAKDIRQALLPTITIMADCDACPVGDRIASSIAWCYLKAYAEKFGSQMIDRPWPDLRFNEDGQKKALEAMCKTINGRFELDKFTRSLQLALLSAIKQTHTNPNLLIRSMHYLYFLVMAKKFGAHVIELNEGLDELLEQSSVFSKILSDDTVMPELKSLYAHYQTLENNAL